MRLFPSLNEWCSCLRSITFDSNLIVCFKSSVLLQFYGVLDGVAFYQILFQHPVRPDAELGTPLGFNPYPTEIITSRL